MNISKRNDPRFWIRWHKSGALGPNFPRIHTRHLRHVFQDFQRYMDGLAFIQNHPPTPIDWSGVSLGMDKILRGSISPEQWRRTYEHHSF